MTGTAAFVMQQFIVDSARVLLMEKSSLVSGGLIKQIGPDDNRLRRYRVKARSRHVARIWPREGRRNPGGLLSTKGLLSKGASSLQRDSYLYIYRASSIQRVSSLQRASPIY